jgi:peptide deformylase
MAETLDHAKGRGLAACQVGILKRLVVIDMGDGLIQLVNPTIIETSGTQEVLEGCLSIPNKVGKLKRPQKVTVKALNEKGEPIMLTGEDELAKCFCHEIDHLDGILYTDKVTEYVDLSQSDKK